MFSDGPSGFGVIMRFVPLISSVLLVLPVLFVLPEGVAPPVAEGAESSGKGAQRLTLLQQHMEEGETHEAAGRNQKAASSYLIASNLSRISGNHQQAIKYGLKARELSRLSGPPDVYAKALLASARAYLRVGKSEQTLALAEEAIRYAIQNRFFGVEAKANELIGLVNREADFEKALVHFRKAFDYYDSLLAESSGPEVSGTPGSRRARKVFQNKSHVKNFIDITVTLGSAYIKAGRYREAEEVLAKASGFPTDLEGMTVEVLIVKGDLYEKTGEAQKAFDEHFRACSLAERLDIPHLIMKACRRTGQDLEQLGRRGGSISYYEKAIRAIEDQRSLLQSEDMRSDFFDQVVGSYNDIILALARLERGEEAFAYSERSRARTFLDLLASKADLSRGRASALVNEEMDLKRRMSAAQIKLEEAGDIAVKDELDALKREYEDFLKRLRREDPEHASLLSAEPLSNTAVQNLLAPNQVLIEYHVLRGRTVRWIIRKGRIDVMILPEGRDGIRPRLNRIRTGIEQIGPEDGLKQELRELHALLLDGVDLQKDEEIIFVPHDTLHYLPFSALVAGSDRYLVQDHLLSYLSSASLLQFTRAKSRRVEGRTVAFGNPDLDNPAYNLRYAEREAREIKSVFPDSTVFVGRNATETRAKELTGDYSVVHFAVHAELNEQAPRETALLLTPDGSNDGSFSVDEVFGMTISSSLVVLSACETQLGSVSRGDELIGMTRAFIYAGAPSVITTLWKVNDKASYLLMREFYQNVRTMRKPEALRRAQISLIASHPHPFYWAAFLISGDTE